MSKKAMRNSKDTQPGGTVVEPWHNVKLFRLMSESYWKATGEVYYPDKKVVQEMLRAVNQEYQFVRRISPSEPVLADTHIGQAPEGALTRQDMEGLASPDLLHLMNIQIGKKRNCEDGIRALKATLSTLSTNIHNIRAKMRSTSETHAPTEISDHAILRYLQRVKGIDLAAARDELDSAALRESIKNFPDGQFNLNGVTYVVRQGILVTVIYDSESV